MRILVVEDERQIAELVEQLLVDYNYAVDIAADGEAGLAMAAAYAYDSIVLDIGLPKLDGIEVCKRLRSRHYRNPILLLTGRSGSENKAIALNAGADDYVVKPFDPIELIARVQALLRRPANGERPILSWGNLTFDPNTRQVSYGERLLILTPKEYAILELLLRNPRSPLSSKAILERVWTADEFPAEEVVRGHIKELRHKLTAADAPKDLIKTAYGVGYRLNPLYATVGAEPSGIPQVAELAAVNQELRTTLDRLRTTQDILRASEERYRLFSEASPVGIFRNGVDGHCTYVNEKTAQLVGLPPAECLGLNWLETLHPEDRQWVHADWCDFVSRSASGETATYSFECRHVHSDGAIVWVLVNIVPERDAAGAIAGYMGTLTDISDRKQAEAGLRASEAKYRSLFESIEEGFAIIELVDEGAGEAIDYRILEINQAYERQSGLNNVVGKLGSEIAPQTESYWLEAYAHVVRTGEPLQIENYHQDTDRWYLAHASRVGNGDRRQVAIVFDDITERKRQESHQSLLAEITYELARLNSIEETMNRLGETIGRYFGVTHCVFTELSEDCEIANAEYAWNEAGLPSLKATYRTREFLSDAQFARNMAGEMTIVNDTRTDPRVSAESYGALNILSFVIVPLVRDGIWRFMLSIIDRQPRGWRDDEAALMQEIANRIWTRLERARAEAALQERERMLSLALSSAQLGTWDWDILADRMTWSDRLFELLGYRSDEVTPSIAAWRDRIHPDDLEWTTQALQRDLATQAQGEVEYRIVLPEGSVHWLLVKAQSVLDAAGQPVRMAGIAMDITDRKQSEINTQESLAIAVEAALRDRQQAKNTIAEQAALLDIATDAIFVRCLENCILYWNQGAERMYGWTAAEALGQTATELLREPTDRIAKIMQTLLERGEWQGELQKFCKSGRELTVEGRWTLVRDEFGQPKSILCVNTDITEKKQLQAQFYQAQRLESLGTLASGIAHDLNNVLTPVLAFAQILRRQTGMDEKTQAWLQIIENNARRGADMVSQILTFARGTIGERIPLQINHLLRDVVKVTQQTFPKSIDIDRYLPADLSLVAGDATQLHQVFLNLCVNARDAMPQGGRLRIRAENYLVDELFARLNLNARAGNYILVTITDTGMGIPPEILDRIFDPFFTTKPIGEGTGLGLATVLGIVTNHGGFVRVTSTVGVGTEFKIYLPAIEGEAKAIAADTASELPRGNGEIILIVDDDAAVREANRSLLEEYEYQSLIATDGIEAMAVYAQQMQAIDLVLIDAMMPNASGATAIRTIRRMNPRVKILAISGLSSNRDSLLEAGASEFLAKPYQLIDLLPTIARLLND